MNANGNDLERRASQGDVRAQVSLGLTLERAGQADAAMHWLSIAAQRNDAEALMLVGLRLVLGQYGPTFAPKGLDLLRDAAECGNAEAARHLAHLHAIGIRVSQSWPRALDFLEQAARIGDLPAREALAVLAGLSPGEVLANVKESWSSVRKEIDLAAVLVVEEPVTISSDPLIRSVRSFAPPGMCSWITKQAEPRLRDAQIYDRDTGKRTESSQRNNAVANFGLLDTNMVNLAVQAKLASVIGVPLPFMEGASVLRYLAGQQAGEHYDFLDPGVPAYAREIAAAGQRIATGLVYLGNDYEAGSTEFPQLGIKYAGEPGSALIFANVTKQGTPDLRTEHAGRPPAGGTKWVFSNFARDRRVIGGALDRQPG